MRTFFAAGTLAIAGMSAPASAAVKTFDLVVTPRDYGAFLMAETSVAPFEAGAGDTIELTLRFPTPLQIRKQINPYWIELGFIKRGGTNLDAYAEYELSGAVGPFTPTGSAQFVNTGSTLSAFMQWGPLYATGPGSIESVKVTFQLYSGQAGELKDVLFTVPFVPEPTTWAMMIVGFGLAGTAARRVRYAGAPVA